MSDTPLTKIEVLKAIRIGQRVAEEEVDSLEHYFIETNQWNEIFEGEKDLVFGPKGAGKSALYALVNKRSKSLSEKNIEVTLAENPIGDTVFRNLEVEPPPSEIAFTLLWKLYVLTLTAKILRDHSSDSEATKSLIDALNKTGLLPGVANRESLFASVRRTISNLFNSDVSSLETTVAIDPVSGIPVVTGKVNLSANPSLRADALPVNELLRIADQALEDSGKKVWVLFDRLDVAFSENADLERNALRALFRAYRDLRSFNQISLKLFIRNDVWSRITEEGFAEASHLVRATTISWDDSGLRNLIVRRLASNPLFCQYVGYTAADISKSADVQQKVLSIVLPDQVEIGKNPATFDWILSRISDGSKKATPRELIHMLDEVRRIQIERLERAEAPPSGTALFDRAVFKLALKRVSEVRYQQTFRAENPSMVEYTDALKNKKSEQTLESLSALWEKRPEEAKDIAERLVDLDFFEKRTSGTSVSYWVPFVYRDALNLVQGKADI